MASRLNPYLAFPGTAREAMQFYADALGGSLEINTFGEAGMPGAPADGIMHARLETPSGYTLMASDLPPGDDGEPGKNIAVSISGDDADELRGYWEKLAAKSKVTQPLEKAPWGDEFGMLDDPYGVTWMVNITAG